MTGAAAAQITVKGTGRIGIRTTEGAAAVAAVDAVASDLSAAQVTLIDLYDAAAGPVTAAAATAGAAFVVGAQSDANIARINVELVKFTAEHTAAVAALSDTSKDDAGWDTANDLVTAAANDIANLTAILASAQGADAVAAVAKLDDTTAAVNRVRISFAASGETDSGISYGLSARADQSNTTTGGSQYISGAFGKIKMGDLGGADKDAVGHIAGGVGVSGMGSANEILYQAAGHNLGYEFSASGITFGYSQDTAIQTGSNSAMGIKWSGDMAGTGVTIGLGQSKLGTATQSTMSVAVSMGGLSIKGISSTNDNGPAVTVGAVASTAVGTRFTDGSTTANNDTDYTGVSVSYAMDAVSVTAYTKKVATLGAADEDYTGIGFTYDMGGATLKAGMVDNNDISVMDIGVSFSF
jgi:outer membrane protein OmpU